VKRQVISYECAPYQPPTDNCTGKACFLCEDNDVTPNLAITNECATCTPSVVLPKHAPKILEHMGAHILFDANIKQSDEPCRLCLRPSPHCTFYLKKGKGIGTSNQVDFTKSKCANQMHFSYSVASSSSLSSPCSNVPLRCPICPASEPCMWRYNFPYHMHTKHPAISVMLHEPLWRITSTETYLIKETWLNRHRQKKMHKARNDKLVSLIVSEAHSSRLALR